MSKKLSQMSQEEITKLGCDLFNGWTGGAPMIANLAEDMVYTDTSRPSKKVFNGKKEVVEELLGHWEGVMQGWRVAVINAVSMGNEVAIEWAWDFTHNGATWDGIEPTGKLVRITGATWYTLNEDLKIQNARDYWNNEWVRAQMCAEYYPPDIF